MSPDVDDPYVLGPGLLPTPFTADEIRAGCPDGRTIRLLVEPAHGESFVRVNRFALGDEQGATIERWREAPGGGVDGDIERERSSWLDLQRHAAFPEKTSSVTGAELSLEIGRVECLRYDTRLGPEDDAPVGRFWFARAHAGMPVRYELPAEGGGVDTTTMIADEVVAGDAGDAGSTPG